MSNQPLVGRTPRNLKEVIEDQQAIIEAINGLINNVQLLHERVSDLEEQEQD